MHLFFYNYNIILKKVYFFQYFFNMFVHVEINVQIAQRIGENGLTMGKLTVENSVEKLLKTF